MIACRRAFAGCLGIAFALCLGPWPFRGASPGAEKEETKPEEKTAVKEAAQKLSPEEQYVRDNLEKFLSPTSIQFLEDGRVNLIFNFGDRKEEHTNIFTPPISETAPSAFRWALDGEFTTGTWGRSRDRELSGFRCEGIRIGDKGVAHLNVWFQDNVEAEMAYIQCVSSTPRQMVALVFTNASGESIGCNFGSQCVVLKSGAVAKVTGTAEKVLNETETRFKLEVRDGTFTAYRDNRKRDTAKYTPKKFASGRIGFVWGGGVASFIHRLEITGRIDAKKMAQEMKKVLEKKPDTKKKVLKKPAPKGQAAPAPKE